MSRKDAFDEGETAASVSDEKSATMLTGCGKLQTAFDDAERSHFLLLSLSDSSSLGLLGLEAVSNTSNPMPRRCVPLHAVASGTS